MADDPPAMPAVEPHAVHEEASVLEARIARLEEPLRAAPIVDRASFASSR